MKAGRKPTAKPSTTVVEVNNAAVREGVDALQTMSAVDVAVRDSLEIGRLLGHFQLANFTKKIYAAAEIRAYEQMKIGKKYKHLTIFADGKFSPCADIVQFCEHFLGSSYSAMEERLRTLHILGDEIYEATQKIGFKREDLRSIRALPPEQQEMVKVAMATESLEKARDLLQELCLEYVSVKADAADAKADAEAKDQLLSDKQAEIDSLHLKIKKAKKFVPSEATVATTKQENDDLEKLDEAMRMVRTQFNELAELAMEFMEKHSGTEAMVTAINNRVAEACESMRKVIVAGNFQMAVLDLMVPVYDRPGASGDVVAGNAG